MASMFKVKFGFILNKVFGKNSPVTRMMSVDMMVWIKTKANSLLMIPANNCFSMISAIRIPYMTRAILFPTNMVEIKLFGFLKKMDKMRVVILPSLRSISNRSLLAETKAISIPEKNAEKAIVIRICMMILPMVVIVCQSLCYRQVDCQ